MKKFVSIIVGLFSISCQAVAQKTSLPLTLYSNSDSTKPLVFYISGDGGFNKFSNDVMQMVNKQGYAVMGLNAKEYFWNKKTPQEAANDIERAINESNKTWKKKNIVIAGYSFGADVAPFVFTHFSIGLSNKISNVILLSPSAKTDLEIHVLQMLGLGKNSGFSVPAEINKISKPVTIIVGHDETGFPFDQLTIKNKQIIKMQGGHHYDGDVTEVCKQVVSQLR